ncbi:hypothetical protein NQ315_005668 [Exocentrus adspersus]|uniref:Integrase catalytic domain-containing protein n=1 Tax=Exocentrus adspersus TaxID=1586481 RepID=A0AAV8VJA8_9CUCU|nr:hypothetical protein NQ315_005668 [Exocentrus adspersus]
MSSSSSKHATEKIQLVNELHKTARKNYPRRRTIIKGLDDLWQSDLAEMGNYAKDNRQYKYILVVIDCFSKFLWTRPIKNKRGQEVTQAFEDILLHTNKRVPTNLQTDQAYNWLDILPEITDNYNESRHSTTGYKPIDVTKSKEKLILKTVYNHIKISGRFYAEELQKTTNPDVYLVEKVLRRKGQKIYVKWLGLDKCHNSWIEKKCSLIG